MSASEQDAAPFLVDPDCPTCKGKGMLPPSDMDFEFVECPTCLGPRRRKVQQDAIIEWRWRFAYTFVLLVLAGQVLAYILWRFL